MTDHVHVVFAANRAYLPYLATALFSVRHGAPAGLALKVTVLSRDVDSQDIQWRNRGPRDSLRCVAPVIPDRNVLPIRPGDHLTVETYYRLFMEFAFDEDVDRVVYLDADLVVMSDIALLASVDLGGRTVGAVRDCLLLDWSGSSPPLPGDGGNGRKPYFNAGVLVIDLGAWRRRRIRQRALEFLSERRESIRYWDQDALNFVLDGDWLELDPRWNRMTHYWARLQSGTLPYSPAQARRLKDPFIVHFASPAKPWQWYRHPDRPHFDRFAVLAGQGRSRLTFTTAAMRALRRGVAAWCGGEVRH